MRILGVDPGTRVVGYGLVARRGARFDYVECGVTRLAEADVMPRRLLALAGALAEIIAEYAPQVVALETAFHGVNALSALKLGQARGAVMLVSAQHDLPVAEYAPALVKRAVVGHGRATKADVQRRIQLLCRLAREPAGGAPGPLGRALGPAPPDMPPRTDRGAA